MLAILPNYGPVLAGAAVAALVAYFFRLFRRPKREVHGGSADGLVSDEQWEQVLKIVRELEAEEKRCRSS